MINEIDNGKLATDLNANSKKITNLDVNNTLGTTATPQLDRLGIGKAADSVIKLSVSSNTGSPTSAATGTVSQFVGADGTSAMIAVDSFGNGAQIILRRADGTLASKTAVLSGGQIGFLGARPYDGNYLTSSAGALGITATENFSPSAHGSSVSLETTANTTATRRKVFIAHPSGGSSVGATAVATDPGAGVILCDTGVKTTAASDILKLVKTATATLDFPSTSAQSSADLTITLTGAALNDSIILGVSNGAVLANTSFSAWVSATDTVTVRLNNYSSSSKDPSSGTFRVTLLQF